MRGAQYDEARWHNVMKQGPRYDEAGEQERGSVFVVVSFFFGLKKKKQQQKTLLLSKNIWDFPAWIICSQGRIAKTEGQEK